MRLPHPVRYRELCTLQPLSCPVLPAAQFAEISRKKDDYKVVVIEGAPSESQLEGGMLCCLPSSVACPGLPA